MGNIKEIRKRARATVNETVRHLTPDRQVTEEGGTEDWYYLGSVQGLTPSGKIYTSFANSNVSSCPKCKGEGHITDKTKDPELYELMQSFNSLARLKAVEKYGYASQGLWPAALVAELARRDEATEAYNPRPLCAYCDGMGSREAYEDSVFQEELEEAAGKVGGYITSGEGSMDDLFLVVDANEAES
jgi:hypothetical protein